MPKYVVEVVMNTCVVIEVEAHDEAEARALAIEEADPYMTGDWDYDVEDVYRDGDDEEDW